MNETTKVNFNNADGSFNRDKWLDFMNTKINSIGFYSAWTGHTAKIIHKDTKKIAFNQVLYLDNDENRETFVREYTNFYGIRPAFYYGERWDKEKGWVRKDKENNFYWFMKNTEMANFKDLPKQKTLFKVTYGATQNKTQFVLYMPEYNAVRTLGYWEYAGLGLKKYIYFKYENYLKKLGVL